MSSGARVVTHRNRAGELANLGARLVRFGQALQEPSTTVSELGRLAKACGINFKLRVASDSQEHPHE